MTPLVLDASAGVELVLRTPLGRRLEAKLPGDYQRWVPEHFYAEVAAVLRRHELHGRYSAARIAVAFERLVDGPATRVAVRPLLRDAWLLRANLTVADALYVVLARHLDCELVTADQRLANAPTVGIQTITP